MKRTERSHATSRPGRRISPAIALLLVAGMLAGCSSVPDYLNPVEWYKDTKDWVMGDDDDQAAARPLEPVPGGNQPYPSLSSVPQRPAVGPTEAERSKAAAGLAADSSRARYSDEVIRSQSAGVTPSMSRPAQVPAIVPRAAQPMPPPPIEAMQSAPPTPMAPPPPSAEQMRSAAPAPYMGSAASAALPPIPGMGPPGVGGAPPVPPATAVKEPKVASALSGLGKDAYGRPFTVSSRKIETVFFRDGSSQLSKKARARIRAAYRAHRAEGGVLRVVGHASSRTRNLDPMRHHLANFRISMSRANRVAHELIKMGVKADRIFTEAMSDSQPAYTEVMPAGEGANRRAEILLEK